MQPSDYMRQAHMTAHDYMMHGMQDIADLFGVEMRTPQHIDLCKALLPGYMQTAAADFAVGMEHERSERIPNDIDRVSKSLVSIARAIEQFADVCPALDYEYETKEAIASIGSDIQEGLKTLALAVSGEKFVG